MQDVKDILLKCTVIPGSKERSTEEGQFIVVLPGQLDYATEYKAVKKALELIGGKWKTGKTQGFVFDHDPTELLGKQAENNNANLKKDFQYFPTPDAVVNIMLANIGGLREESVVLEPSAGQGAIIRGLRRVCNYKGLVDYCEIMDINRTFLEKLPGVMSVGTDFLELAGKDDYYDFIFANPPFTKGQDIDHIYKMYEVLKPGGTIITLASPSFTFNSQKKYTDFKAWLWEEEKQAQMENLAQNAFKESGTAIAVVLLVIHKPEGKAKRFYELKPGQILIN